MQAQATPFVVEVRHQRPVPQQTEPVRPLGDAALTRLAKTPGFFAQFEKAVPVSHLRRNGVRCTCGELVEFAERQALGVCPGGCGRAFLRRRDRARPTRRTGQFVFRVARWGAVEPDPPCECADRRLLYEGRDALVHCANCDGLVGTAS